MQAERHRRHVVELVAVFGGVLSELAEAPSRRVQAAVLGRLWQRAKRNGYAMGYAAAMRGRTEKGRAAW